MTSSPWWESDKECRKIMRAIPNWTPVELIRAAARRAVESHGHVTQCLCHRKPTGIDWQEKPYFMASNGRDIDCRKHDHPHRDLRCLQPQRREP